MRETKLDIQRRKIRNGNRKQAERIAEEKQQVWDSLKYGIQSDLKIPSFNEYFIWDSTLNFLETFKVLRFH